MLDLVKDVCDRPTCRVLRDLIAWVTELKHVSAPTEFMLRISSMCTKISDAPTLITRLSRLVALDCCYSSRFIITPRKTAVIETPPPAAVPLDKFVVSMVKVSSVVGRKSGDVEHAIAGMRKKAPSPEAEELGTLILTEPVDYEASIEGYIVLVDRATPEARRHVLSRMMHLLSVHAKYLLKEGRLVREMLRVLAKWVDYFEHDMITDGFRFCLFIDDTAPEELRSFVFMLLCAGSKKGVINNGDDVVGRMLDAVREGSVDELRSSVFRACLHFLRGSDESDYVSAINLASICCSEFGIDEGLARDMATAILSCGSTAADYGICFLWREHPNVVGDVIRAKSTNKALHYFIEGKVDLAWDAWADHVDADLLRVFVLEGFSKNDEKKNKYMYHLRAMVADHGKYGSMTRIRATQLHLVLSHIGCNEAASWADQLKSCSVRDSILEEALSVKLKREFKVQQQ
jgi:hypothetical protein